MQGLTVSIVVAVCDAIEESCIFTYRPGTTLSPNSLRHQGQVPHKKKWRQCALITMAAKEKHITDT